MILTMRPLFQKPANVPAKYDRDPLTPGLTKMSEPSIQLVIFDWAGTTVDHGSFAPIAAMRTAFADSGVEVSVEQLRAPMGLHKLDHIQAVLAMPAVAASWRSRHDREPDAGDAERIYHRFLPLQKETAIACSTMINGVVEAVTELRDRGIRIAATTGYPRMIGEAVAELAASRGYSPEVCVYADDTPAARPAPWMVFHIMRELDIYPGSHVVKVGDTVPDIEEGRNAGCWSIGVTRTGSELGLTAEEVAELGADERQSRLASIGEKLTSAGAHAVIESVADLPGTIDELNERLQRGKRP